MRCPFHHRDAHLIAAFTSLIERIETMASEIETLTAAVAESNRVSEAALILLDGLKAQLDAAIGSANPRALKELSDSLGAESAKLAAKEAALNPPPPAPAPVPAPAPTPTPAPAA